jgi:hypothetical protein
MGLPSFFATTTLRTLSTASGEPEDRLREIAEDTRVELLVGDTPEAKLAGAIFVELYARTFGALRLTTPGSTRADLEARARAINPRIELGAAVTPNMRVGLNTDSSADLTFAGSGWWVGQGTWALPTVGGASPIGPMLAGILAFNETFKRALHSVLGPLAPVPTSLHEWTAATWQPRPPEDTDFAPLEFGRLPTLALVGCGAIGHAIAYAIGAVRGLDGAIDLIDPQPVSTSNLQRYLGTVKRDADGREQKVSTVARLIEPSGLRVRRHGLDWAAYRRRLERQGEIGRSTEVLLVALDSAEDRRIVQGSLPRLILNGWTRIAECGTTGHTFVGDEQCLACTYLNPATQAPALHDVSRLLNELGLPLGRIVRLLAGASLERPDLRAIERSRGLAAGTLDRWRGESLRPLYGELCGMANIELGEQEQFAVPLPQVSALAGTLVAADFLKLVTGQPRSTSPLEVSLLKGPGTAWISPLRRKSSHPAQCICKDETYLNAYRGAWVETP